ncbi:MAG: methyltransferase domain-containing protein [Candidatus Saccharimonadales bacterium]
MNDIIKNCYVCGSIDFSLKSVPVSSIPGLPSTWSLNDAEERIYNLREGYCCDECYSSARIQGLSACLSLMSNASNIDGFIKYCNDNDLDVAEINSCANLHEKISKIKKLKFSEYYNETEQITNARSFQNIKHEDIMNLSYADSSFDLVLHSETLEHINNPEKAMQECLRVLKPGGVCVFTTPVLWGRKTRKKFNDKGEIIKPLSYHGDSNSQYPVLFEFGSDIAEILNCDLRCFIFDPETQSYVFAVIKGDANKSRFCINKLEIINSELEKQLTDKEKKALKSNKYDRIFNNFMKDEIINDGERMIPEFHKNNLFYTEHLQRYNQTRDIVKGKVVLDIASGSGYGTKIISKYAKKVYGVDINYGAVNYARENYSAKNIEYMTGSGTNIPIGNKSVDVVTTFETIEHIDDYESFIKEIKRVLKPDGLAIISTPNDLEYGEGNHFHIHEFEHKELLTLIEKYFKNTKSYFQSTWKSVLMGELKDHESPTLDNVNLMSTDILKGFDKTLYFYIICSNRAIDETIEKSIAIGPHLSEANEWSARKQELAYIEELKNINQNGELLKQEITELRRSNSSKDEILDNILKSKKYKAVTKIAKLNKALKNPKMFINKLKDKIHHK